MPVVLLYPYFRRRCSRFLYFFSVSSLLTGTAASASQPVCYYILRVLPHKLRRLCVYADTANVVNLCEFLSLFCPRFALISFLPVLLAFPLLLHCLISSNCPCVCQPAVVCIFVMRSRSPSPSSGSSGDEHEKERDGESSRENRSRTRQRKTGTERPAIDPFFY